MDHDLSGNDPNGKPLSPNNLPGMVPQKHRSQALKALPEGARSRSEIGGRPSEKTRGFYSDTLTKELPSPGASPRLPSISRPNSVEQSAASHGKHHHGQDRRVTFDRNGSAVVAPHPSASAAANGHAAHASHGPAAPKTVAKPPQLPIPRNEPKVMVPYVTEPTRTPRKIRIERQKRLFMEQNIEQLLQAEGIDYSVVPETPLLHAQLPLEVFDDTTFDPRTNDEWNTLIGLAKRAGERGIPAKALSGGESGGRWRTATVVDYNVPTDKFLVDWEDGRQALSTWLPRVHVLMLSEDPFNFAKRVAAAHESRKEAESFLRYNLYIDSMPINDTPDHEEILRILANALSVNKFRNMRRSAELLTHQVGQVFGRAINKIIFDQNLSAGGQYKDMFSLLFLPQEAYINSISYDPTTFQPDYPIDENMFAETLKEFKFQSFLPRVEIIDALVKVRTDCNRIAAISLFNMRITKSVRLEEFEQIQTQSYSQETTTLRESLLVSLKNGIKTCLKDVGKGWFNLQENRMELYQVSKLKKFMNVVKFMMEDSMRFMVQDSLEAYARYIEVSASSQVTVLGPADVKVQKTLDQKRFPLFMIDLSVVDSQVAYMTPPKAFEEKLIALYVQALSGLQNIPTLEREIMENLIWTHTPKLASVHPNEVEYTIKARIQKALVECLVPLHAYMDTYETYREFLALDVAAYVQKFKSEKHPLKDYEEEISAQLEKQEEIERSIPDSVSTGMFFINCVAVRSALAMKRKTLANQILELLVAKARKCADKINTEFIEISKKVLYKPPSIEELTAQKEYIKTIPRLTQALEKKIKKMTTNYELVDKFNYTITQDDFDQKWAVYGWNKKLAAQLEEGTQTQDRLAGRYEKELKASQEAFASALHELQHQVANLTKFNNLLHVDEAGIEVRRLERLIKDATTKVNQFHSRERLFGLPETPYEELQKLERDFQPYADLWLTAFDWLSFEKTWSTDPFNSIDAERLDKDVTNAWRRVFKVMSAFKEVPECLNIASDIKAKIDAFKPQLPLISALRNPGMRERHWKEISDKVGFRLQPDDRFTLKSLFDLKLDPYIETITGVCDIAGKEYIIESTLDKMQKDWVDKNFTIIEYKDTKTYILKGSDEISQQLDDQLVLTQSMSFSVYKKAFEKRIAQWEQQLSLTQDIIEEWLNVQKQWLYLEPIFSSDDIHRQMPTEGKRFTTMDRTWRMTMGKAFADPDVLRFTNNKKLLTSFQECNKLLELVQKGLSEYLETKCSAFPRFYFLSADDLLQILSQTKDPTAVQPHLHKCFENIERLEFQPDLQITAMESGEHETVKFTKDIYAKGSVEYWLLEVESTMKSSVRSALKSGVEAYVTKPRTEWVLDWPGQVVLAGSQVFWTKGVETAITEGPAGLKKFYEQQLRELEGLTTLVRGNLSPLGRLTLGALIVIDVHARDVVKNLIEAGVTSERDFEWMTQLRYYWDGEDLYVRIVNASFKYGYEYLGNTMRLVITPLTDRCYVTLTGAIHLELGGAPQGPAGTGKTETTKDLAKALAKQCVVFNCSDGLDYLAMEKFFKGLASSGAWSCFDEFNRIELEVLSVIAEQIMCIQKAIQLKLNRFNFFGLEIALDHSCAVFITMNPGYAGRSELPDNLKALFRPVAMMVPDYALIGEIMFFSYGFTQANILARKMVATFRLSSEQLSSQDHYDFGMRAVKTVISAAGNIKKNYPTMDEYLVLLRALRDCNMPKFLSEDIPLFNGIISDLFPGVEEKVPNYGNLMSAIRESIADMGLQPVDGFIAKCIQLYETTVVRHGLMLVGPTGGGKTTCYRVLQRALTKLGNAGEEGFHKVLTYVLNPKSITMGQLYGEFEVTTHEWTDGVLANLVRIAAGDQSPAKKWIVFDGPVDAIWIENMNTVLDDNKKLCLNSGEIITLTPPMTMMFEVEDLAVASPATVSRCGMIHMEPTDLGVMPLVLSWMQRVSAELEAYKADLQVLFDTYLVAAIKFLRASLKEPVPTVDSQIAQSLMNILDCFFTEYTKPLNGDPDDAAKAESRIPDDFKDVLEFLFFFAVVWSVGASTNGEGRKIFDGWLRQQMRTNNVVCLFPDKGLVYDYQYDKAGKKWVGWMANQPEFVITPSMSFQEMIVPTIDTVRYAYLLELLAKNGKNVLCAGPTGTGKSVVIEDKLTRGMENTFTPIFVNFSARTSANQTQDILDSKFDKRRKNVYGPPAGRRFVVFVDDLNMPQKEKYGAQPPIELLRQWCDHGGWYDRKTLEFNRIIDIGLVGAMGPPGGGRNPITKRFTRHFNLISFVEMADDSLKRIFETILAHFLNQFGEKVKGVTQAVVSATIEIYNTIAKELLPTPSKSHYTFNLRDIAKVFQGILSVKKIDEPINIVRLWAHECTRVFSDRLVDNEDRNWFQRLLETKMFKFLKTKWDEVLKTDRLVYGDFMVAGANPRVYAEIDDMTKLTNVCAEYLDYYNNTADKPMNLVLFLDAIGHLARICRVIRQPRGHALLLGMGGSGKQSLTRLATSITQYDLFQIELSSTYGVAEWKEDLQNLILGAGLEEKKTVFLISDTQIVKESFLEDINGLLNTGDVPNLWMPEHMEKINTTITPIVIASGLPANKEMIYAAFLRRVTACLHVVITMSPIGDTFRNRLRQFPSLVNCCTIDWFSPWPREALISVASKYLKDVEMPEDQKNALVEMCMFIHTSVEKTSEVYKSELNRTNYVTPTNYLELLASYKDLIGKKKIELTTLQQRLQIGLDKLADTTAQVAVLKAELIANQPLLEAANRQTIATMEQIKVDKASADETRVIVEREEEEANKMAEETKAIADDAERDLAEALPALEAAEQALKTLNKNDITEVKSLQRPPAGVKMVMETVCILLTVKPKKIDVDGKKVDDYWEGAKKVLNDVRFLESLIEFDKDNIDPGVISKLKPYIDNPGFKPAEIAKVSKACTSLCLWVRAIESYYHIARAVAPKRERLKQAQESLAATLANLNEAKAKLKAVMDNVAALERSFAEAEAKKAELEAKVRECELKLVRAAKLMDGIGDERDRWIQKVKSLSVQLVNLVGDALMSAGVIAYAGTFTPAFRAQLGREWERNMHHLPHTPGSSILSVLGDPVEQRAWTIFGLPTDQHSIENATVIQYARRWPLCIDPQGQANKWIKRMEKDNGLDVIKLTTPGFTRTLENAIRFGKPVLLENVGEELEPVLEPVLLKQTFKQQGNLCIKLGDSIIPYHEDFRFYITTKLPNPHYKPEVATKVTLLNFTLTPQGLEDQLLGLVVEKERPDLEEQKNNLVVANAQMKKEVKEIEDKILLLLANSKGKPLDDETLIDALAESKKTSLAIKKKMAESEEVEKQIDDTRMGYRPVAVRASVLFFCIVDLSNIDHMYQYSLNWFLNLFVLGIANAKKSNVLAERLDNLNKYFTYSLYNNVCRSLFEQHKLLFSFLLTVKILENQNLIDQSEYRFLLTGTVAGGKEDTSVKRPDFDWLSDKTWSEVSELSKLAAFKDFNASIIRNPKVFKRYFDSPTPHHEVLPEPFQAKLSSFQKLLVLRCFRPDKVVPATQEYIAENLGSEFLEPPTFDLPSSFKDASPATPLIFILSPGADPTSDFYKFAEEMKMNRKVDSISLGQGQGQRAEKMIQEAMEKGAWVLLQNCHLASSWMPTLEKIVDSITPDKVHRDFRLWLTSMPSDTFPVMVLQNGVKMTNEPPKGIKANLLRSYKTFEDKYLSISQKEVEFRKMLFGLCFFHAVVQERRKFGALGWNIPYEFNNSDLSICLRQLRMFLEEAEGGIPFKLLNYLSGEINYGGRVTDDWDRRLLRNILSDFYTTDIVDPEYKFSPSGTYQVPPKAETLKDFMAYIRDLPINDHPEVFGMHENADMTCAQQETFSMFENILLLQPRQSGGKGKGRDAQITDTANDVLKRIPASIPQLRAEYKPGQQVDSMVTVLTQEIVRYNRLLAVINSSLNELLKAIKGLVVMSASLEQLATSIFNNQIPELWANKAYPSLKPLASWVTDLEARLAFIQKWTKDGPPNVFWMSGLFFPQAFLTGAMQNYARKYVVPIDTISFDFEVLSTPADQITAPPADGCYVDGLFLEGAHWDAENGCLGESNPKELYTQMSVIWLKPTPNRVQPTTGIYRTPVYKTLKRAGTLSTTGHSTNFILTIDLPSREDQKHWIKRGVALVCALSY
eukprot:TRINITY_DN413_c0_g1_i5.p1 TRINITY_DN413_c0_g1~~TRINITY_DN413_c0_g1_i5.p1  ORF type:complete len:4163 (-),score=2181.62 TRINITY_DN413_c0_g1_i5:539-13027(-)